MRWCPFVAVVAGKAPAVFVFFWSGGWFPLSGCERGVSYLGSGWVLFSEGGLKVIPFSSGVGGTVPLRVFSCGSTVPYLLC